MAERKAKAQERHRRPMLNWRPAEGLAEWLRKVAAERKIPVSQLLNEIVGRARQDALGLPVPPQPQMGRPPRGKPAEPPAGTAGGRLPGLRELARRGAALREQRDTEGEGG